MFDLDEEELRRAARELTKAAKRIQDEMLKDAMFGEIPKYSPFVSAARMASSIARRPLMPFVPLWTVTTSPYIVEKKKRNREVKLTFWQRLWRSLTDLNPWPYSPIEYYEVDVPAVIIDKRNHQIICHPSLEGEIKNEVNYEPVKR